MGPKISPDQLGQISPFQREPFIPERFTFYADLKLGPDLRYWKVLENYANYLQRPLGSWEFKQWDQ